MRMKEQEDRDGREWNLVECHNWMMKELKRKTQVQQYKALFEEKPERLYHGRQHYDGSVHTVMGTTQCSHCKRMGHDAKKCWFLHPELRPSSSTTPAPTSTPARDGGSTTIAEPVRQARPFRSSSAPPPRSASAGRKGDGKSKGSYKGKSKGKGKAKGAGRGKGEGRPHGRGKGTAPNSGEVRAVDESSH